MKIFSILIFILSSFHLYGQTNDSILYKNIWYHITPNKNTGGDFIQNDSLPDGKWATLYNGTTKIAFIYELKNGKRFGKTVGFTKDGNIIYKGQYNKNGKMNGKWISDYGSGMKIHYYKNGKLQ